MDGSRNLEESILEDWAGFNGEKPVRIGNGAADHLQHDIFGEMVLALTPIFFDERLTDERSPATLKLIEALARKAISLAGVPDAGIWEYRTEWKPQTFSSLMCWAAADRMARIAEKHSPELVNEFRTAAGRDSCPDHRARWKSGEGELRRPSTAARTLTPPCCR